MNRTIRIFLAGVFFVLCFYCSTMAQVADNDAFAVYRAYIDKDMDAWQSVIDRRRQVGNPSAEYLEETINYEYGFVAWCLADLDKHRDRAKKYWNYAAEDLEKYKCIGGAESRIHAYISAFTAYDMKIHPMKVPFIGMKSVKASKDAIKADSTDFFVYIQNGNVLYYLPKMLGGSKEEAIESYKKAWKIMQADYDNKARHNWLYLNLLLTIADAYKGMKFYGQVQSYYDSVLNIAPDFEWVKNCLYPSLEQHLEQSPL